MKRLQSLCMPALLLAVLTLAGCERPPVDSVQRGYRGTGMEQVYNPRILAEQAALNTPPEELPAASPDGPKAGQVYQNVKVLGDQSVGEFARTMVAMTNWVAPKQGCVHCHNAQNFADDSLYTKVVARRMLQMTQKINTDYKNHVGATGVTCYTCHRGQNVPNEVWFKPLVPKGANSFAGDKAGQNQPAVTVGLSSLPLDPFTPFLLEGQDIRVQGDTALPAGNRHSIKQAEWTYGLMVHMSTALGVNCSQCHNTRSFGDWNNSSPPRLTAWHGIRMARELNNEFMLPLTDSFPAHRLGPGGDVAKLNCATCHQGAHKPLYGATMAMSHPELLTKSIEAALPAAAASAVTTGALTTEDIKTLSLLPASSAPPKLKVAVSN
ncbi:MAG: photosynthetic reaction center cytochrome c subunit [Burkholderiaceae bacterium]|nr:photosynthetic reaction center cytochrome c subunit [Burkholderiaceae bacterium]